MSDRSMFAGIRKYANQEFADEYPVIWFITPETNLLYRVFSVCRVSPYDTIHYGVDGVEYKKGSEFYVAMKKMAANRW